MDIFRKLHKVVLNHCVPPSTLVKIIILTFSYFCLIFSSHLFFLVKCFKENSTQHFISLVDTSVCIQQLRTKTSDHITSNIRNNNLISNTQSTFSFSLSQKCLLHTDSLSNNDRNNVQTFHSVDKSLKSSQIPFNLSVLENCFL